MVKLFAGFFLFAIFFVACKKDNSNLPAPTTDRNELTKDSMFLYAKELYLWNDALPSYSAFNPRVKFNGLSDNISNLNAELFAITRYAINPSTNKPYEYNTDYPDETKYSFIDDLVADGKLATIKSEQSSIDFNGEGNDLGYSLALIGSTTNYKIYFRFTSPGSPAALAGLNRGDYINKINGTSVGTNYNSEESFINTAINQNTITIGGKRIDGTSFNVTLNKTKYNSSPIYKDTIIVNGAKKIGYLAYAKFTSDSNSDLPLTNVFQKFADGGVTDLVIDLRYNGGGYVSTAEHLINLIAPNSLTGKTMFVQTYNANLQAGKASILRNQAVRDQDGNVIKKGNRVENYADDVSYKKSDNTTNFNKEGSLNNITKVVFITTENTASASELVINSLKPYLDVKTVGSTSYGKPVGFFPVRIDKFDIYMSSFSTTNANGDGFYYAGITPDALKDDDVTKAFGDPNEKSFAGAIAYIVNGKFTNSSADRTVNDVKSTASNIEVKNIYQPNNFKGMIGTPKVRR
nr:S41 family peptidase [uncultured Pedobacter sp.]